MWIAEIKNKLKSQEVDENDLDAMYKFIKQKEILDQQLSKLNAERTRYQQRKSERLLKQQKKQIPMASIL